MIKKIFVIIAIVIITTTLCFVGCKEATTIDIPSKGLGAPTPLDYQEATFSISEMHALSSDVEKAILLFRYASYNQNDAPFFHFVADSSGDTIVGGMVSQSIRVQVGLEYFHQVISKVASISNKAITPFISLVEMAKRRVNYNSLRYRYDGRNISFAEDGETLIAAWKDPGSGVAYTPKKDEYSVLSNADFDMDNAISSATINTVNTNGRTLYQVNMVVNVSVINTSDYSMDKLKSDTNANPVSYREYEIDFEVWDSGYFRSIIYRESWEGKLYVFEGSSVSTNSYMYSYDIEDCDLTAYIEMAGIPLAE